MFELIRPGTKIDFVGKKNIFLFISGVLVLASLVGLFTKGLNYGIDFLGGAEIQVRVPADWDIQKLRDSLEKGGVPDPRITQIGDPSQNEYLVKVQTDEASLNKVSQQVEGSISAVVEKGKYEITRADVVGPAAGASLRKSGFLAVFYALLGILIYVSIRFDMRYSPGAVLALFHDTIMVVGVLIITQTPFDLTTLAAILALVGYSNNDTIIIFDRIRETMKFNPNASVEGIVNQALNETLGRSMLTSLATFLSTFAIWAFGGEVIRGFAFTFMIGIIVGAYSSIFIAGSMVIYLTNLQNKREGKPAPRTRELQKA